MRKSGVKMTKDDWLGWLFSEPSRAALAGIAGGIVRWLTLRSNWKEGVGTLIVGALCAIYAGQLALPIVEGSIGKIIPGEDMTGLSSFLVGIGGISISGLVLDIFDRRRLKLREDQSDEK